VHHHISEKLTQDNYILWQFLMVPFLKVKIYSGMSMEQLHDPLNSFPTPHPVSSLQIPAINPGIIKIG